MIYLIIACHTWFTLLSFVIHDLIILILKGSKRNKRSESLDVYESSTTTSKKSKKKRKRREDKDEDDEIVAKKSKSQNLDVSPEKENLDSENFVEKISKKKSKKKRRKENE